MDGDLDYFINEKLKMETDAAFEIIKINMREIP